jgi:hypothetical protein
MLIIDKVDLKGAEVREIRLSLGKYLALVLMLIPKGETKKREVKVVEVLFEGLHRYETSFHGAPWMEVLSCRQMKTSDFLKTFSPHSQVEGLPAVSLEELTHFEITFDGGSINVLAENWSVRTIETLPVQDGPGCPR